MPNRGAMVSKPTMQQAREVFEARCVLESALVAKLLESATRADKRQMRMHLQREKEAYEARNRRAIINSPGNFTSSSQSLPATRSCCRCCMSWSRSPH